MKSIASLRNPTTKNFATSLEEITISEAALAEEEGDQVSSVLLALNHLSSMTDDLYSVVGDEDIKIDEDEIVAILNAYDVISEIYEKYEGMVSMPSREYDIDALDVEVMEEIEEQYVSLQEALTEAVARTPLEQKELDVLKKLGFATAPVSRDTWLPSEKIVHMWGIPMRAGKFADVFFAVFDDKESKKFAIADSEGVTKFTELEKAMAALKKKAKMVESVELDEAGIPPYAPSKSLRNPRGSVDDAVKELDKMISEYKKRISTEKNAAVAKELKRILGGLEDQKEIFTKVILPTLKEAVTPKIVKWPLVTGINDPFRMEVVGKSSAEVTKILDTVLPSSKFNVYDNELGFKSVGEREAAGTALVKYFKTIKEEDCSEFDIGVLAEEFDETKFRRLAMTGLVPDGDAGKIVTAMKRLDAGKELSKDLKDLITSTFLSLIGLVTGDTSVFNKIQGKLKA